MTQTLIILLFTQFLAMMSPGPDMFLILKNSLGQPNGKTALFTILGIGLGLTVHITVSVAGLAILLIQSESLYRIIRYAGAAYLAYLGAKSLFARVSDSSFSKSKKEQKSLGEAFREGLFTNLLNPKVTLYILSLFTQLIPPGIQLHEKALYGMVLIIEAILIWLLFAKCVNLPAINNRLARFSYWIDRLFGIILLCIAGSVFIST